MTAALLEPDAPDAPEADGDTRVSLTAAAARLEGASAEEVVAWAWACYGEGLVLAASFQDCVLIDVVASVAPRVPVVFLDTGYHFAETLAYVEQVRRRYGLDLRVERPDVPLDGRYRTDPTGCCAVRKVAPLRRALAGRTAWMTGLRRSESPARAGTPVVSWEGGRGLAKVAPIATWTDDDVALHRAARDLPVHPLTTQGYPSIGCAPCTRAVAPGEDVRAGRWAGSAMSECGLHLPEPGAA